MNQVETGVIFAMLLGVVAIITGVVAIYQTPEPVEIPETYNWKAVGKDTLIKWINDNFISNAEFSSHNNILNKTLDAVVRDLDSAGLAIGTLNNKFIIIEHQGDIPTTSPISTAKCAGDFNLITINLSGNDEIEFTKIQTIFIKGSYDGIGEPYSYKVKESGKTAVLKEGAGTVAGDGSLLGVFNEAVNQSIGDYTTEVKIRGITDCITFKIVP